MKAMMLTGIGKMEMSKIPEPVLLNPKDVKIRMSVLGICGSDITLSFLGCPGQAEGCTVSLSPNQKRHLTLLQITEMML